VSDERPEWRSSPTCRECQRVQQQGICFIENGESVRSAAAFSVVDADSKRAFSSSFEPLSSRVPCKCTHRTGPWHSCGPTGQIRANAATTRAKVRVQQQTDAMDAFNVLPGRGTHCPAHQHGQAQVMSPGRTDAKARAALTRAIHVLELSSRT
jgi:hypothetical protein